MYVAVCCSVVQSVLCAHDSVIYVSRIRHPVLQCVAVCCSVLQCVAVCCSVLQCVAVCGSVLTHSYMCHESDELFEVVSVFCETLLSVLQFDAV